MNKKMILSTGEMAKIHAINKKTLMYYDEIGLFSPAFKDDNGYRYYLYEQCMTLESILSLRKAGATVKNLIKYVNSPSPQNLKNLLHQSRDKALHMIRSLQNAADFMERILLSLEAAKKADFGVIAEIEMPSEKILACQENFNDGWEKIVKRFSDELIRHLEEQYHYYMYGSILPLSSLKNSSFDDYSHYYLKVQHIYESELVMEKPAGKYLVMYWKGNWDTLPDAYRLIVQYADEHNLCLCTDSYEENIIDDFMVKSEDDFVTKIMAGVR